MKRWTWMWLVIATATSGCGARWVSPADDVETDAATTRPDAQVRMDVAVVTVAVRDAGACLAPGVRCRGASPGCCVGFCNYQPYGYGPGVCVTPQADGQYCEEDRGCSSGHCVDEVCRSSACVAMGERCETDDACCGGFCTASSLSYAPGVCAVPQAGGAHCIGPQWCASRRCVDSVCAPSTP